MKLNAARVFVRDIESARQFYAGTLGLAVKADGSSHGYVVFALPNTDLVVESVGPDAPQEEQELVGRFTGLSFDVADIQSVYQRLLAMGVKFSGPPERQVWGGTLATFSDGQGNELQLVESQQDHAPPEAPARLTPTEALRQLAGVAPQRFVELFRHGTLQVEIYKPEGEDRQQPHARDEVYAVISGTGQFFHEGTTRPFEPGEVLFVPAGHEHRFEGFSDDFVTWVFFYGPEGGEAALKG